VRRPRRGARRKSAGEKRFQKIAEKVKSAKGLRFGKRRSVKGRYVQEVKDQQGRVVARVPWNQRTKRQVRTAVEVFYGTETRKTVREAGMAIPGWAPVSGAYDIEKGEAIWTRQVWKGVAPVGTPDLPKRDKSFGYFGSAFEAVQPERFQGLIDALPDHMLRKGGSVIGLVFTLEPREGGDRIKHVYFKDRIDGYLVTSPRMFLNTLFADGLMDVAHEYGYAGEMDIVAVELMVGGHTL
jgi:hypothetical protein